MEKNGTASALDRVAIQANAKCSLYNQFAPGYSLSVRGEGATAIWIGSNDLRHVPSSYLFSCGCYTRSCYIASQFRTSQPASQKEGKGYPPQPTWRAPVGSVSLLVHTS